MKIFLIWLYCLLCIFMCSCSFIEEYEYISSGQKNRECTEEKNGNGNKTYVDKNIVLTIDTYYDYEQISLYAKEFMADNPNVEIVVRSYESESINDYIKRISTELMTNRSADIIDFGYISVFQYAQKGYLCDLYNFMESDENFDINDYYCNVFRAKEYNGGLYSIPFYFIYDVVYVSKPLFEKAGLEIPESINYEEMITTHEMIIEHIDENILLMPGATKESFWDVEFPIYYDISTKKATFDSDSFLKYLECTNKINTDILYDMTRIYGNDDFLEENYLFSKSEISAFDCFNFIIDYKNASDPILFQNSQGQNPFLTLQADYGISQTCKHKEIAWEFIKYCISEKSIPNNYNEEELNIYAKQFNWWIPININNFYTLYHAQCMYDIEYMSDRVTNWKDGTKELVIENALKTIHNFSLKRDLAVSEIEIAIILEEDCSSFYYHNTISAKKCAELIQRKMEIFLSE